MHINECILAVCLLSEHHTKMIQSARITAFIIQCKTSKLIGLTKPSRKPKCNPPRRHYFKTLHSQLKCYAPQCYENTSHGCVKRTMDHSNILDIN